MTDDDVKAALRVYAEAAVAALLEAGHTFPPPHRRDWGWQATGANTFFFRSIDQVEPLIPWDLDGLHSIPAFTNCMEALRAHPVIGPRLDTLVGSALGSSRLESDRIPDMVLYSMLPDADALAFEVERFDRAADELIAWLTRRQETYTVIAPLSGLITEANPIVLQAGIEIDEMTDAEVVDALTFGLAGDHPAMTGRVRPWFDHGSACAFGKRST